MGGGQGKISDLKQQKREKWKDHVICNFVQVDQLEQYCQTMEEGDYLILFNSNYKNWASARWIFLYSTWGIDHNAPLSSLPCSSGVLSES